MKVEISIAVFNEEKTLSQKIKELIYFLENNFSYPKKVDFSIVIADNGSSDSTAKIAKKLCKEYNFLSFVRNEKLGVGRILKQVWTKSTADYLGYMDLDLATDLKHLSQAIALLDSGKDIVYADRLNEKSQVIGRSIKREICSRVFNLFLRLVLKVKFKDGQCGFKFLKKEIALKLIDTKFMSDGLFFASQILIFGECLNVKMQGLPVRWVDSPTSKIRLLPLSIECLKEILKTKRIKKYIKNEE